MAPCTNDSTYPEGFLGAAPLLIARKARNAMKRSEA